MGAAKEAGREANCIHSVKRHPGDRRIRFFTLDSVFDHPQTIVLNAGSTTTAAQSSRDCGDVAPNVSAALRDFMLESNR
jgi:hypothetical protein